MAPSTVSRASSLLHRNLELDALALDDDPPRLDLRDAEPRDDASFFHHLIYDLRLKQQPQRHKGHKEFTIYD